MSEISLDPILTDAGLAALRNADATGIAAKIAHGALGDVGGTPVAAVQALQNERLRVACFSGGVTGNRQITLTANVAAGTPEFFVKEIGFFLEDGTLFAFWSHPEQALGYRSQTTPWFFKFVLSWNVAGTVDVVFDTTAVLACISQDTAVLDAKIRHTIESENITPDDADEAQLTDAIEKKIDEHSPDITAISATSGTVSLNANTLYKMTIDGETTFTLPSAVNAEKHNQIKILTNLSVVSAINFGTTKYFNCEAPDMSEAGLYDIYLDYDPHQSSWVAGAIRKGAAE